MSSEISIAKDLSGPECLDACLTKLRDTLSRYDLFHAHMSYPAFRAQIKFEFWPQSTSIPDVELTVNVERGAQEQLQEQSTVAATVVIDPAPPNAIREDAGLPLPVLVTHGDGTTEEKWVKRGDLPSRKIGVPKNRVNGAA